MQMWDISGQSISSRMINNYICGAHAILLCYDITNYESFANLEDWYRIVRQTFATNTLPFIGLIANKCVNLNFYLLKGKLYPIGDLSHMRAVKSEVHNRFADENVLYSFMMSAKSGDQVWDYPLWKEKTTSGKVVFLTSCRCFSQHKFLQTGN